MRSATRRHGHRYMVKLVDVEPFTRVRLGERVHIVNAPNAREATYAAFSLDNPSRPSRRYGKRDYDVVVKEVKRMKPKTYPLG